MSEQQKERREKRVSKNYMLHVSIEGFEGAALTSNISRNGMMVLFHDEIPLDIDREMEILIAIEGRMFTLTGKIKWKKKLPDNYLVGVELTKTSEEFRLFWDNYHP
jgi:hypothetical protein